MIYIFYFLLTSAIARNYKGIHQEFVKHPLHGVQDHPNNPIVINAVMQIPFEQNIKFQLDQNTGLLLLDRVLSSPVAFPVNYGFLPRSLGLDNDPLDVMIVSNLKIPSLTIVSVRVLGVMRMTDTGQTDDKLIGVIDKQPAYNKYKQLFDIPSETIAKIKLFFQTYKTLENKKVTVNRFDNRLTAYTVIQDAKNRYKNQDLCQK